MIASIGASVTGQKAERKPASCDSALSLRITACRAKVSGIYIVKFYHIFEGEITNIMVLKPFSLPFSALLSAICLTCPVSSTPVRFEQWLPAYPLRSTTQTLTLGSQEQCHCAGLLRGTCLWFVLGYSTLSVLRTMGTDGPRVLLKRRM